MRRTLARSWLQSDFWLVGFPIRFRDSKERRRPEGVAFLYAPMALSRSAGMILWDTDPGTDRPVMNRTAKEWT